MVTVETKTKLGAFRASVPCPVPGWAPGAAAGTDQWLSLGLDPSV